MADAKALMNGKEVLLVDIEFEPGADPYSQEDICKNFFQGWTASTPWGDATWRIIHPDDFPMSDVWNGQLMLGAQTVIVNGRSYRLDAVAGKTPDGWVVRSSSEDPKMPWWLFPLQSSATEKDVREAQEAIKPALEAGAAAVSQVADHDDALLWASAYAWALQNTRRSFNQLYKYDRAAAKTRSDVRTEIEAAFNRAEWSKEEIRAILKHPRQEIRTLGGRIVMRIQGGGAKQGQKPEPSAAAEIKKEGVGPENGEGGENIEKTAKAKARSI